MGHSGIPIPLVVTLTSPPCPVSTVYGSPPTFTATVTRTATMTFYLDGVAKKSVSGISASLTPDAFVGVGVHTVTVVATSGKEKSETTCSWVVETQLAVTMPCPEPTIVGSPPTFIATANKSVNFAFYLDGVLQLPPPPGISASFTPGVSVAVGTYTVKVIRSLAKLYSHFIVAYTCDETKAKSEALSSISISFC